MIHSGPGGTRAAGPDHPARYRVGPFCKLR